MSGGTGVTQMRTRVFQSDDAQAVWIPRAVQFEQLDIDYEIERQGDCLVIRPAASETDTIERFSAFSADFMAEGRPEQGVQERDALWLVKAR